MTACMVVSKDQKEELVGYYQVLEKPNHGYSRILLKGLNGDF
ncbi:GH36 C-terminal domain-containing protein [Aeribacillus composti]|uniref:GH36 C-terminal domain-containing protein n=1 Tax=Aeribacillus composti TaxID=1868734 RepID=A0ABY9WD55_9BACI|nr:GH36 C-terminal domain-containing protein [Aeribacillus composti]WNF34077.1 GH36 C-terminal domain-containing protein [Aeribacillus composti]